MHRNTRVVRSGCAGQTLDTRSTNSHMRSTNLPRAVALFTSCDVTRILIRQQTCHTFAVENIDFRVQKKGPKYQFQNRKKVVYGTYIHRAICLQLIGQFFIFVSVAL